MPDMTTDDLIAIAHANRQGRVRLNCWCMFAVVGESDRVKKSNFLKKVNGMVRRYDMLIILNINQAGFGNEDDMKA